MWQSGAASTTWWCTGKIIKGNDGVVEYVCVCERMSVMCDAYCKKQRNMQRAQIKGKMNRNALRPLKHSRCLHIFRVCVHIFKCDPIFLRSTSLWKFSSRDATFVVSAYIFFACLFVCSVLFNCCVCVVAVFCLLSCQSSSHKNVWIPHIHTHHYVKF